VLEEWCAGGPERFFVPMMICQLWDPPAAAAEIRRCAALGTRALAYPEHPSPAGLPGFHSDYWDPIWDACQETGVVLCLHVASSGHNPSLDPGAGFLPLASLSHINGMLALTDLVLSPVCTKFPELQFVWSEAGIGWIPAILERCDRQTDRHTWVGGQRELKPSEIFQRNMYSCMVEEPVGISLHELIGAERIMAETDYPHSDTTYPLVQDSLEGIFAGIPDQVVDLVTHGNAERAFRWEMADPLLLDRPDVVAWRSDLVENPHAAMDHRHGVAGIASAEGPSVEPGLCDAMTFQGISYNPCREPLDADGHCSAGHVSSNIATPVG
jgi:predicted TIM-barrel fold metal-dependent hydrolase